MIGITTLDKQMKVEIDTGVKAKSGSVMCLYWDTPSELVAGVMARDLQGRLDQLVSDIRKAAYLKGHQDGRRKVVMCKGFSGSMKRNADGAVWSGCW